MKVIPNGTKLDLFLADSMEDLKASTRSMGITARVLQPEIFGRMEICLHWKNEDGIPIQALISKTRDEVMHKASVVPSDIIKAVFEVGNKQAVSLLVAMSRTNQSEAIVALQSVCDSANEAIAKIQVNDEEASIEAVKSSLRRALKVMSENDVRRIIEDIMTVEKVCDS